MTAVQQLIKAVTTRQLPPDLAVNNGGMTNLLNLFNNLGGSTFAGTRVDHNVALTLSAVYRSVWLISMVIATQPTRVYRTSTGEREGERETVKSKPRYAVFRKPNPEVSAPVFWATALGHEVLTGNCFLWVVPDTNGVPVQLWVVEPERVQVGRNKAGIKIYLIDGVVPQADFNGPLEGNIVHVMGFSRDGLRGISPIERGVQSHGLSLGAEQTAQSVVGRDSTPGGILTTEQALTEDEAQAASEGWEKKHGGPDKSGKIAVFGKGTKWMSTQLSPTDQELLKTRSFQVEEVQRWFGIPDHLMLRSDGTSNWGTGIAEQGQAFVNMTLNPHTVVFESTIEDTMLPDEVFFDYDSSVISRGNFNQQVLAVGSLIRAGFDPADVLRLVGIDPMEHTGKVVGGGGGDEVSQGPAATEATPMAAA